MGPSNRETSTPRVTARSFSGYTRRRRTVFQRTWLLENLPTLPKDKQCPSQPFPVVSEPPAHQGTYASSARAARKFGSMTPARACSRETKRSCFDHHGMLGNDGDAHDSKEKSDAGHHLITPCGPCWFDAHSPPAANRSLPSAPGPLTCLVRDTKRRCTQTLTSPSKRQWRTQAQSNPSFIRH